MKKEHKTGRKNENISRRRSAFFSSCNKKKASFCPALAAQGADKRSLSLAVCLACLLYAGITAVCISVLGPAAAAQGSYAVLITLKSGTALLSLRMLLASLAFYLTLLKPAVNLANSALLTARRLTDGKWLRPVLCAAIFALSLCVRGMISALL